MSHSFSAAYLHLLETGALARRVEAARASLTACKLCPWACGANRIVGETDTPCSADRQARVSDYFAHFGQEHCLSGTRGSGAIFFSGCTLNCLTCINPEIRAPDSGQRYTTQALADAMLYLQRRGCHNLNLLTPTHYIPQILDAVYQAAQQGLKLPLVYNTSGYERVSVLRELLSGVIDIYLPDLKFADEATARHLCQAPNYPQISQQAVQEMYRQVGDLMVDEQGLAQRGLLVTHLVLPANLSGTQNIARFVARHISPQTAISLLPYLPNEVTQQLDSPLNQRLSEAAFAKAAQAAYQAGWERASIYTSVRNALPP